MKKLMVVMVVLGTLTLTGCGAEQKVVQTKETTATVTVDTVVQKLHKYSLPKNLTPKGNPTIIMDNIRDKDKMVVRYMDFNNPDRDDYFMVDIEKGLDFSLESFIFLDDLFISASGGNMGRMIDLNKYTVTKEGEHILTIVQFPNNDVNSDPILCQQVKFKVLQKH